MDVLKPRPLRAALVLAGVMLIAAVPALAQDESPPESSDSADLASLLPSEIGGMALEPASFTLTELFGLMDVEDPEQAALVGAFEMLAASLDVTPDEAWFGSASAVDLETEQGVLILALKVPGVDGTTLVEPFVETLMVASPELFPPAMEIGIEEATIGDKDVFLVAIEILLDGEFDDSDSVGYGTGDFALFLQGFEASILEALEALP